MEIPEKTIYRYIEWDIMGIYPISIYILSNIRKFMVSVFKYHRFVTSLCATQNCIFLVGCCYWGYIALCL